MNRSRHIALDLLAAAVLLLPLSVLAPAPASGQQNGVRISVLVSTAGQAYDAALAGFRSALDRGGVKAEITVYAVEGRPQEVAAVLKDMRRKRPTIVFTLGGLATDMVGAAVYDVPVVAGMVLTKEGISKRPNVTGVALEFPVEIQLEWITRVLPRARTVGVLYHPAENGKKIESAAALAPRYGLALEARQVLEHAETQSAIDALVNVADVVWGIPDETALNPHTAKTFLLFSFRNRIPLIGPSTAWVKAGALYALERDYGDVGAQCGEMALRILRGEHPSTIAPAAPRKIVVVLNLRTANQMRIAVPDEIVRAASSVY